MAYLGAVIYPIIYLTQYEVVRSALFGLVQRCAAKLRGQPPPTN